jgi:hypothetical protein
MFEKSKKELLSSNFFDMMTSLSKLRLAKLYQSENDHILLNDLKTISFDVYSKKNSKIFLNFIIEQNGMNKTHSNSFPNFMKNEEEIKYIRELRKKEIVLKCLKPLTSRISKITLCFEKKQFREAWRVAPTIKKIDEIQNNEVETEKEILKRDLFLIETRLAKKWTSLDYDIEDEDERILELLSTIFQKSLLNYFYF